jgi:hypothetical protein
MKLLTVLRSGFEGARSCDNIPGGTTASKCPPIPTALQAIGKATVHQAPVSTVDMGTIMANNEPCSFRSKGLNNLGVTDITFDGPIKEHRVRTQIRKSWRCFVTSSLHQLQPFLDIIFSSVNTP